MLESLHDLEVLSLSGNRLTTLPPGVFTVPTLRELDVSNNNLSEISEDVALLQNLEVRPEALLIVPAGLKQGTVITTCGRLSHSLSAGRLARGGIGVSIKCLVHSFALVKNFSRDVIDAVSIFKVKFILI